MGKLKIQRTRNAATRMEWAKEGILLGIRNVEMSAANLRDAVNDAEHDKSTPASAHEAAVNQRFAAKTIESVAARLYDLVSTAFDPSTDWHKAATIIGVLDDAAWTLDDKAKKLYIGHVKRV